MRLVIALFALLLGACRSRHANAAAEGKRVMLLGTTNTNPYIGAWTSTFSKFATQAGMKVTNLSSNYDAAVQSQQIDDAIAQKFDIIVMVYVNDQAMVPALTRAKAAGIPVVLVVTPLQKEYEDLFTSYIGTDHADLGRLAGEAMVKGLQAEGKTKAQIVAVTGVAQQLNVQTRIEAFKDALAKQPGYRAGRQRGRQVEHRPEREDHRRIAGSLQRPRRRRRRLRHGGQPGDRRHPGHRVRRPEDRRRQQGHRGGRQQLHEGRRHQYQAPASSTPPRRKFRPKRPRLRPRRSPRISAARS